MVFATIKRGIETIDVFELTNKCTLEYEYSLIIINNFTYRSVIHGTSVLL